ncbi:MAG: rhodanese-like domain-containing protein [Halioglobus sp.]
MNSKAFSQILLFLLVMCFGSLSNANTDADAVWIDVRSMVEHSIDNIEGDIRMSDGDVVQEVGEIYPDKNTEIRLYCRSGGRAEKAMSALRKAGYTNVSNVGGINDARNERGLVE